MTNHVEDHQPPDQEQVRVRGLNWDTLSILTNLGCNAVPPRLGSESKPLLPAIGSSLFGAGDVQPKDERARWEPAVVSSAAIGELRFRRLGQAVPLRPLSLPSRQSGFKLRLNLP